MWESTVPGSTGLHYRNTDERNEQRRALDEGSRSASPSCFSKLEMGSVAISTQDCSFPVDVRFREKTLPLS